MIHPSCSEVLATISTGFERQVVPFLADTEARSAAATIGHLLRHVALRIEGEGQLLVDDIARLKVLLGSIGDWFEATGEGDAGALRDAVALDLPSGVYPSLALLGEQALALRSALISAQRQLHAMAASRANDPQYAALRQSVRDYIAAQLDDEATLIEPAFQGKGPRR